MPTLTYRDGWPLSAVSQEGPGSALDTRAAAGHGWARYMVAGNSAVLTLQASDDLTAWFPVAAYTATATQTGTATISSWYPFVRATVTKLASAAGGTATAYFYYAVGNFGLTPRPHRSAAP